MSNNEQFIEKYPIPLLSLLVTPIIFKEGVLATQNLPAPSINHLRDLCEFGNHSYGAIRTTMTRARKKNLLGEFVDENGKKRYCLTEYQQNVGKVVLENRSNIESFSLAVFTFEASQSKERYRAREILGYFGFRMIAQNVYIRRKISGRHLEEMVEQEGLANNIFVFECEDPGTPEFKSKLYSQFDILNTIKKLHEFKEDLVDFLDTDLNGMELARRIFYSGPVQHEICFEDEPPLPGSYYPDDYPMAEIIKFYEGLIEVHKKDLVRYYMAIENLE